MPSLSSKAATHFSHPKSQPEAYSHIAAMEIRRAIGLVKDKTSIRLAKAARNADGDLEALVVKVTSHKASATPDEKHLEEIAAVTWSSKPRAYSCVNSISKRLQKTRDWAVALKSLILVHRLLLEGGDAIREEIAYASGGRFSGLLDLSGFKDELNPDSWDYSEFVISYSEYLGEKVRVMVTEEEELRKEDPERDFGKVKRLQGLLDRVLRCRPSGVARSNKIVIAALHLVVVDSFEVYGDLCERLSLILDEFPDLGLEKSTVAFELYVKAAKQIDGLYEYYGACRDVGVGNSVGYPEVKRISDDLLKSLEEFLKVKLSVSSEAEATSTSGVEKEEEESTWMLPPPPAAMDEIVTGDLIDLTDMALAVFSESESPGSDTGPRNGETKIEDWEMVLVESARDLARRREELHGGFENPFDLEKKQQQQQHRVGGASESVMMNQNNSIG